MSKQIEQLVIKLASYIEQRDVLNTNVSKVSVGWHLAHSLLTINAIIYRLTHSNPSVYKPNFNMKKFFVLTFGKIPRSNAQAPSHVIPKSEISAEEIQQQIALAHNNLLDLPTLQSNNFFSHPMFGDINTKSAIKFLVIHTQHHLSIMDDIILKS